MRVRRGTIVVPGTPPSVNHYKVPVIIRGHISFRLTTEAETFRTLLWAYRRGVLMTPEDERDRRAVIYRLRAVIYRGRKGRGDFDNYWKVLADSLVYAGVIHSDAAVDAGFIYMRRDRDRPRTEITIWSILPDEKTGTR